MEKLKGLSKKELDLQISRLGNEIAGMKRTLKESFNVHLYNQYVEANKQLEELLRQMEKQDGKNK